MVNINPNDQPKQDSYKGTLKRYAKNSSEKFYLELLFKLADTSKDGNVDENELRTLEQNLSERSIFGDGVFDNKEFKDFVKDYNKPLKSDPSKMLEFSKEDFSTLKDMKTGISQSMFDKFKEFCNIRLGKGDTNTQLGINGKLSLDASVTSKQDQTGDCYLLTAVNLLSRANDGDLSDYIKPDGKGGAVISYKGTQNYQGGTFDAKVYESEINLIRQYQKDNPIKSNYMYGSERKEYSILSKGDDDVLAMEVAEMKRKAYSRVKLDLESKRSSNLPEFLQNKKTELINNYINGLSSEDKNELSKYILQRKKLEPKINELIWDMEVSDEEIRAFEFDDELIQKIKDNPKIFEHLKFKFNQDCCDAEGNEKETLDDECVAKIRERIKLFYKNDNPRKNICQDDEEVQETKRDWFEKLIKIMKVEDGIQNGKIKLPEISNSEIRNYKITEEDLKQLYPPNKKSEVFIDKIDKYLMDQFSNMTIKDDAMLKDYHTLISKGGNSENVLKALAGAESISSAKYKSAYQTLGYKSTKKDREQFEAKRKAEIMQWIQDADAKGYSNIAVSINGNHEVLFKSYDAKNDMLICYNPWDMNREEPFIIDSVSDLTGIKLPPKK